MLADLARPCTPNELFAQCLDLSAVKTGGHLTCFGGGRPAAAPCELPRGEFSGIRARGSRGPGHELEVLTLHKKHTEPSWVLSFLTLHVYECQQAVVSERLVTTVRSKDMSLVKHHCRSM